MKRIIALFLSLTLLFSSLVISVSASESPFTVKVESTQADIGQSNIAVDIALENNPGISGFSFCVDFDTDNLVLVDSTINIQGGYTVSTRPSGHNLNLAWTGSDDYVDDGVIATLYFNIPSDAVAGDADISIVYREGYDSFYKTVSGSEQDIEVSTVNGAINILETKKSEKLTVSVGNSVLSMGSSTVTVPISVNNNTGFSGFSFCVDYDKSRLKLESAEIAISDGYKIVNQPDGYDLGLAWTSDTDYTQNGTIAYLNFSVIDSASSDESKAYVNIAFRDKYDSFYKTVGSDEVDLDVDSIDGYVAIKSLSSISVSKKPTKLIFLEGKDSLDVTGGKIALHYNDGTQVEIDLTSEMVSGFDNTKVGKQSLTVTHRSKITTFDVEIIAKTLISIAITTKPAKLSYFEGDSFDETGLVVTAYYDNDTSEIITDYLISGYDSSLGNKTITVTHNDKTASFDVVVNQILLERIAVTTLPKTLYHKDKDSFDVTGGKVTLYYNNSTSETVDLKTNMVSGFDNSIVGTQTITVTTNGFVTNFGVTVQDHEYQSTFDANNHFDKCTVCGDVINAKPHKFDNTCDTTCDCGYTRTITHDYQPTFDENNHFDKCTVCGDVINAKSHKFDNTCDTTCDCGYVRTITHDYQPTFDTVNHFDKCTVCGDVINAKPHKFDNACDSTCDCGYTRTITHDYQPTFDTVNHFDKCTVCGDAINVKPHEFDNACDAECNECKYERTPEPHKVGLYTFTNATNHPFSLSDGIYSSTNTANNSSATVTLTAERTGSIIIEHYTSTETNYDKLIIKHNNTTKVTRSGTTSWESTTISVVAGDKIYITYSKDSSQSKGNDKIYFKLTPTPGYSLAENLNPTCENAVICDICGTTVKAALGHSYSNDCDTSCNTCGNIRTVPDHIYDNSCDTECNVCGYTRSITHDHQPTFDENNHFDKCTVCGDTINVKSHKFDNTCDTTCDCGYTRTITHDHQPTFDENNHFDKCTVCGDAINIQSHIFDNLCDINCDCGYERIPPHNYDFSFDDNNHFAKCTACGDVINSKAHEFENDCDTTCDCGYVRTITHNYKPTFDNENHFDKCTVCGNTINIKAHQFDNACDTTCDCGYTRAITHNYQTKYNSTNHWQECSVCHDITNSYQHEFENACDTTCDCGHVRTITHNHRPTFDTVNHFDKCTVCGDTINVKPHKFDNACDTNCDCGYVRTVPPHTYDNDCDTDCNVCGVKRTTSHKYDNNCDTSCNSCGATRTITHTYTNACDTSCNVCDANRTITHSFGEYVYDNNATETADGTKTRTCSVCGHKETIIAEGTKLEKTLIDSSKVFKDVPANKWYKKFVDYSVTYGIFSGTSTDMFSPEQDMTRAQFVQVFANISGVDTSNRNVDSGFSDVPKGKWYTAAVTWAAQNGIVNGVGGGRFDPNAKVTREQMCVMIVNYIENYQKRTLNVTTNASTFADDAKIATWAKTAVYKCAKAELVNGVGNNMFDPKASATRAQGATIFSNFYKEYMK